MIEFLPITATYASLLALLFLVLCARVVLLRRTYKVGMGDGGKTPLACAIRAQANFVEYVPLALILLAMLELNGAWPVVVNALGSLLVVARALHGWGLSGSPGTSLGRFVGTGITWLVLLIAAVINLHNTFT